jgi:hypothetical protein
MRVKPDARCIFTFVPLFAIRLKNSIIYPHDTFFEIAIKICNYDDISNLKISFMYVKAVNNSFFCLFLLEKVGFITKKAPQMGSFGNFGFLMVAYHVWAQYIPRP